MYVWRVEVPNNTPATSIRAKLCIGSQTTGVATCACGVTINNRHQVSGECGITYICNGHSTLSLAPRCLDTENSHYHQVLALWDYYIVECLLRIVEYCWVGLIHSFLVSSHGFHVIICSRRDDSKYGSVVRAHHHALCLAQRHYCREIFVVGRITTNCLNRVAKIYRIRGRFGMCLVIDHVHTICFAEYCFANATTLPTGQAVYFV